MDVNFTYTDGEIDGKEYFLVKLPFRFYLVTPNFKIAEFIPSPNVVNAIKKELNKTRPFPIVYFLRCNSECLVYFRGLANNCSCENGTYLVYSDDSRLQKLVKERLLINFGKIFYNKKWTSGYVNVDALE